MVAKLINATVRVAGTHIMLSLGEPSGSAPDLSDETELPIEDSTPARMLQDAKNGDQTRLGEMLDSYRNYLRILADSRLDRKLRGRMGASDVVQETMLQAHRDFGQFRGTTEKELLGWLRMILAHTLARAIEAHVLTKKRDVRRDVSIAQVAAGVERSTMQLNLAVAASDNTPSSNARRHERAVILADLMSELTADQREVLILRNMRGHKFAEVAELMQRSVPATKMLWMRAIKRLREGYEHRDEG